MLDVCPLSLTWQFHFLRLNWSGTDRSTVHLRRPYYILNQCSQTFVHDAVEQTGATVYCRSNRCACRSFVSVACRIRRQHAELPACCSLIIDQLITTYPLETYWHLSAIDSSRANRSQGVLLRRRRTLNTYSNSCSRRNTRYTRKTRCINHMRLEPTVS